MVRRARSACSACSRLFACLDFGLNSGIVAVAAGLERRTSIKAIWRKHFSGLWVTYFGGVFAAMLLMALTRAGYSTLEVLVLIVPLPVILYATFRHALGRAEDQIGHLGKMNKRLRRRDRGAGAGDRRQGPGDARPHPQGAERRAAAGARARRQR